MSNSSVKAAYCSCEQDLVIAVTMWLMCYIK